MVVAQHEKVGMPQTAGAWDDALDALRGKFQISAFGGLTDGLPKPIDLADHLANIVYGRYGTQIGIIRQTADKKDRTALKSRLGGVRYSVFTGLSDDSLADFSGLVYVDLDEDAITGQMFTVDSVKLFFSKIPECVFACKSCSGTGVSALFAVEKGDHNWITHYPKVHSVIASILARKNLFIDGSTKNVSRFHYHTHDREPWLNPDFQIISDEWVCSQIKEHFAKRPQITGLSFDPKQTSGDLFALYETLKANGLSITRGYKAWVDVAFALCDEFLDESEGLELFRLFSGLDDDYDANKADQKYRQIYKAMRTKNKAVKITLGSLWYHARNVCEAAGVPLPARKITKAQAQISLAGDFVPPALDESFVRDRFYGASELDDCYVFEALYREKYVYNQTSLRWLEFGRGVWQEGADKSVVLATKSVLALYEAVYASDLKKAQDAEKDAKREYDANKAVNSAKLAYEAAQVELKRVTLAKEKLKKLKSRSGIENCLKLAEAHMVINEYEFDQKKATVNFRNGTLDCSTMEFRPHSGKDFLTVQVCCDYDPDATCPRWIEFVEKVIGNEDTIHWLQELFGCFLAGIRPEQVGLYFYGTGANGKSTFLLVMSKIFAMYWGVVKATTLYESQMPGQDNLYSIAKLRGKRFVSCQELGENKKLNESLYKDITGGDVIEARFPYGRPFEFLPEFLLIMQGNHRLRVAGTDHGIWRRMRLVEFGYTFPEAERIPSQEAVDRLFIEASGIVNWCLKGFLRWQMSGLTNAEPVTKATEEYKQSQDLIGEFLDLHRCNDATAKMKVKDLRECYIRYCEERGEYAVYKSQKRFTEILKTKGINVVLDGHTKINFIFGFYDPQQAPF